MSASVTNKSPLPPQTSHVSQHVTFAPSSPPSPPPPGQSATHLQVIVVRVLRHPPVQERPGQVVHGVLLVLDRLCDDLSVEVVVQRVVQVALHRDRLVEELLVEVLAGGLTEQDAL